MVDKSWYEERNNEHLQLIQAIRDKDVEKAKKVNTIHIDVKFSTFIYSNRTRPWLKSPSRPLPCMLFTVSLLGS
ncbi:hypothetical protein LJR015_002237 [Peribacillus frigoritolerans]|uniref:hypothetical protein n=1 Tax=Peribacillus frigoritolerans TaxID=450367 RepID=UPI003ECFADBB